MNLKEKPWYNRQMLQIKLVKYGRRTKNQREKRSCYLFCVIYRVHESQKKTVIQ